jgi:hypothetical protein
MRAKHRGEYRQAAALLGAKPLRVLREHHDTAAEHQQTDNLEQKQKVIFIGHTSDQAIGVPEAGKLNYQSPSNVAS